MLAGGTVPIVVAAMTGGEEALAEVGLEVGRPVLPMLASSAPDVAAAMSKAGGGPGRPVAVDVKLDGIRIQVHRRGDDVQIATRSLDDITERLPEVVAVARALPATELVLDGEAIALDDDGRPRPFQETASRTAQTAGVAVDAVLLRRAPRRRPRPARRRGHRPPGRARRVGPRGASGAPAGDRLTRGRRGLRPRGAGRGSRGRGREEPRDRVRRGPSRLRLGQGEAGPHPRPRRARRGVGQRPPRGLAVQHPSRRARPRGRPGGGGLRDARQDLQGDDRRDARLADRAVHRAGARAERGARPLRRTAAPRCRSSRSPSTASSAPRATPAVWPCASPGSSATATTRAPTRPTPSRRCGRSGSPVPGPPISTARRTSWHDRAMGGREGRRR